MSHQSKEHEDVILCYKRNHQAVTFLKIVERLPTCSDLTLQENLKIMFIAQEGGCGSMLGKYWKRIETWKLNLASRQMEVGKPIVNT